MPEARAPSYYSDILTHAYLGLHEQLLLLHSIVLIKRIRVRM